MLKTRNILYYMTANGVLFSELMSLPRYIRYIYSIHVVCSGAQGCYQLFEAERSGLYLKRKISRAAGRRLNLPITACSFVDYVNPSPIISHTPFSLNPSFGAYLTIVDSLRNYPAC